MMATRETRANSGISVVLCTYNGGRYLREQLQSIAAQSLPPMEMIACDDGSADETLAILREFAETAPFRVNVIENAERLGSTRNFDKGIALASGEFIALCDQDDVWAPKKLESLIGIFHADATIGGVFSDAELIDDESRATGMRLFSKHKFTPAKQRAFLTDPTSVLLRHDVATGATMMFRAALRPQIQPIPRSWVHDGWITWMIATHSRLAIANEPLTMYRIHGGQQLGVGTSLSSRKVETRREFYGRVARQFEDLRAHLRQQGWAADAPLTQQLNEKIAFLKRQSSLSPKLGVRLLQMIGLLPRYMHYGRGLGSIRTDFLLGREPS